MHVTTKARAAIAGAVLAAAGIAPAAAQTDYPARPIRVIVPLAPGGGSDVTTRFIGVRLSERLGQPIVVDNRPGAGSAIASEIAAGAPPDGHTLVMIGSSHAVNAAFNPALPYKAAGDFSGVILIATAPVTISAHPSVPATTLPELIALARSAPGKLNYGSAGVGGINHLAAELLKHVAKFDITFVPYRGVAQALPALVGGEVQLMFSSLPGVLGALRQGRVKAIAVTSAKRSKAAPEIPTVGESGVPGYSASSWFAILAPKGTPRSIVDKLNAEASRALAMPQTQERLVRLGADPAGSTPAEIDAHLAAEVDRWTKVVRDAGIKK